METHMIHALLSETQKVKYDIVQLRRLLETMRWAWESLRAYFLYRHGLPDENGWTELDPPNSLHKQLAGIPRRRECWDKCPTLTPTLYVSKVEPKVERACMSVLSHIHM